MLKQHSLFFGARGLGRYCWYSQSVRKILCSLLIICMTFMGFSIDAHAAHLATHETFHALNHSVQKQHNNVAAPEATSPLEASAADSCNECHCGHGHTVGLIKSHPTNVSKDAVANAPSFRTTWLTSPSSNDIERPNWPVTTPVVVNLLS